MSRFALILYPNFSLQEVTCLTSALAVWFGEEIDYIASENKEYCSEEGLRVVPTKTMADINITDYDCVILPGNSGHWMQRTDSLENTLMLGKTEGKRRRG